MVNRKQPLMKWTMLPRQALLLDYFKEQGFGEEEGYQSGEPTANLNYGT